MIEEIYEKLKYASYEMAPIDITLVEPDRDKARKILEEVYRKCKENNVNISIIEYFYQNHYRHIPPQNGNHATHFLAFIYVKDF
jgi:hypothetical protein